MEKKFIIIQAQLAKPNPENADLYVPMATGILITEVDIEINDKQTFKSIESKRD